MRSLYHVKIRLEKINIGMEKRWRELKKRKAKQGKDKKNGTEQQTRKT